MAPPPPHTPPLPDNVTRLREQHPTIFYKSCDVSADPKGLRLHYHFTISPQLEFTPQILIPLEDPKHAETVSRAPVVQRLAFLIGMVELLSYWKLCCPPKIEVEAGYLSDDELPFWEGLLRRGLGEFFYLNHIPPTIDFSICSSGTKVSNLSDDSALPAQKPDSYLVLVGGGKDSIVTLELLGRSLTDLGSRVGSFSVNPIPASLEAIRTAHYPAPLIAERTIDPRLIELNSQGYLNGHTPFSALLAFISTLTAYLNGYHCVLASNEASASEGNTEFHGVEINHQYSKSFEFEKLFREYISKLDLPVEYVSFLRPLNELQICALFSDMPSYHKIFRSCNREQTQAARSRLSHPISSANQPIRHGWCADCPKCVFTFLCLRTFLSQQHIHDIFGTDPSLQPNFSTLVAALAGFSEHKPFECVGTYEEVRSCLLYLMEHQRITFPSSEICAEIHRRILLSAPQPLHVLLNSWNNSHFLDSSLEALLRRALEATQRRIAP
jgi:hypothetical protein